VIANLQKS